MVLMVLDVIATIINNEYEHNKSLISILIKMNKYIETLDKRIKELENAK
jgi:hypothetical protein